MTTLTTYSLYNRTLIYQGKYTYVYYSSTVY